MNDFGTYQTAMGVGRCGQTSSPCRPAAYVCLTGKSERSNNVLRPVELAGVPRLHCCEGFPAAPHSWPQCPAPCSTGGTGDLVHAHIFLGHLAVASCRRKNKDFGGTRERRCVMTKNSLLPYGEFWIVKRQHIRCAQAVLLPASTPARTNTPLLTEQSVYSWMAQRQRFPWGSKQTHLPEVTTRYRHSNRSLLPTKALSEKVGIP